ncbi:TonB-dependent receptor [Altererythrobacter salegens]|uniref:TonB-dependent receptor n=1 Tax=Croceibacterium salegens TaxID=1737568 RepID=A0A6I4SU75_9SPHN|nr:TonB-dependent receptor [Croceibacterium salegens]MXO59624.1 TonB-dependent receptor [Croceibacterium salegens]
MRSLQINRVTAFKAVLLAGGAGLIAMSQPALAQDDCDPAVDGDCPVASEGTGIVVTGSRIVRKDYDSNSPIVTVDEGLLDQSSTAALEQNLNKLPQFVPAQTPTAGGDIQPTATNTPGAATVSLRGLGTNRNLVLIDGRRATPGNASGVVDINTIPSAAIERVEVITGGASATYGADALAGVTNFILKKNLQGLELDGSMGLTQHGDGFEFQVSGIMGADFDDGRGNVSFAMSMNKRESNLQTGRKWYRDLYADPQIGGNQFFIEYPGVALSSGELGYNFVTSPVIDAAFPNANPTFISTGPNDITTLFGATIYNQPNYPNQPFTWGFFNRFQQGGLADFQGFTDEPLRYKRTADGGAAANYTDFYLILPLKRYNMFARGNYEINDWVGVFGQAMYSHVTTATRNQGGAIVGGWDVFVPYGTGVYTGSALPNMVGNININGYGNPSSVLLNGFNGYVDPTPGVLSDNPTNPAFTTLYGQNFACANSAVGGCTNNQVIGQFFPQVIQNALNARPNPNAPVQLNYGIPEPRTVFTDVDTYNLTAGLEGSIPDTDWTWEAFANFGESITFARQTGTYSLTRARSLIQAPGFGLDYVNNSNTASIRQNVVNGIPYGFGANVATCESGFNIFAGWDNISQDCKDALKAELKNRSKIQQNIWEANATGTLFEMPAGPLQAALGASYREVNYEFINDTITTQNASFLDQSIGIYPSIDFGAEINVSELYGELLIPVLRDSFINDFTLEVGGRISNYNTTGASYTYKLLADVEINDWLRLRGGYNRAERAPNIAELYLTPQQTFAFNAIGDICSNNSNYFVSTNPNAPGNNAAQAADVQAVCQAVMDNTGGPGTAAAYYNPARAQPGAGGGFSFPTISGNPNLHPEVADTWTAGIVVNSPFTSEALSRLRFTVDWFSIKIKDAIGVSPAATVQRCLDPFYNPLVAGAAGNAAQAFAAATSDACAGPRTTITYDPAPGLGLGRITASYTNEGVANISGIDFQVDYAVDIGPGTLTANLVGNYYFHYRVKELANNPLVDYTGTFGTSALGLQTGAFEYRLLGNIGYSIDKFRLGLQWQHLPSVEDSGEAVQPTQTVGNDKSYDLFNLNGSYGLTENMTIRFGVDNLFNRRPPLTNYNSIYDNTGATPGAATLRGGAYNSQFYDTNGRRFYLGANVKF